MIAAVGDVLVNRPDPPSIFDRIGTQLSSADIAFCQLEAPYSNRGSRGSSGPRGAVANDVSNYVALPAAGFDVVSVASNHIGDWGEDAMLDVISRLRRDGIQPIGAGASIEEARQPAVLVRNGTTIAFLGYCSVAPSGYYAGHNRSGVAPMRALTHYEPLEGDQPGTPAEILTWPDPRDLERLQADVRSVRKRADVVIVSLHWGVHFVRALIADYQPVVARASIDAGADAVLGHHQHILKGIEVYAGKPIFYGIGNFAVDHDIDKWQASGDLDWLGRRRRIYREQFGVRTQAEGAIAESRLTVIVKLHIAGGKIGRVSYVPVIINEKSQPVPYPPHSPLGARVVEYLSSVTEAAGLPTDVFRVDEDEVTILTGGM